MANVLIYLITHVQYLSSISIFKNLFDILLKCKINYNLIVISISNSIRKSNGWPSLEFSITWFQFYYFKMLI